ncbi:hypothetical protein BKA69DRAFT_1064091 [Paraphysoderma sedebokerense]|nr:hypothetical protein BKA69DRAFT_1064091 [Paraphysoderma sedebokerense]
MPDLDGASNIPTQKISNNTSIHSVMHFIKICSAVTIVNVVNYRTISLALVGGESDSDHV